MDTIRKIIDVSCNRANKIEELENTIEIYKNELEEKSNDVDILIEQLETVWKENQVLKAMLKKYTNIDNIRVEV